MKPVELIVATATITTVAILFLAITTIHVKNQHYEDSVVVFSPIDHGLPYCPLVSLLINGPQLP